MGRDVAPLTVQSCCAVPVRQHMTGVDGEGCRPAHSTDGKVCHPARSTGLQCGDGAKATPVRDVWGVMQGVGSHCPAPTPSQPHLRLNFAARGPDAGNDVCRGCFEMAQQPRASDLWPGHSGPRWGVRRGLAGWAELLPVPRANVKYALMCHSVPSGQLEACINGNL